MEIQRSKYYPYAMHFPVDIEPKIDTQSFTLTRQGILRNDKLQLSLRERDIVGLRDTMKNILAISGTFDFVATFALGGVFPLNYMARVLETTDSPMLPDRYHLFSGLYWETKDFDPKYVFLEWVDSLPNDSRVLLFDTGNDGQAGGQIFNLLTDHYRKGNPQRNLYFEIHIIATRRNRDDKPPSIVTSSDKRTATISLTFHWVDDNPFEDAVHFIGYESLRSSGHMKARKFLGGVGIEFPDRRVNAIISADLAGAFLGLFVNRLQLVAALNSSTVEEIEAQKVVGQGKPKE